jgi:hypothetical protein
VDEPDTSPLQKSRPCDEAAVMAFAHRLACKSARVLRAMKAVVDRASQPGETLALGNDLLVLRDHIRTQEFREGLFRIDQRSAKRAKKPD